MELLSQPGQAGRIQKTANQVLACNEVSLHFGLALSNEQALELSNYHLQALHHAGRIEFGASIIPKIIYAFCDSGFIAPQQYAETLEEILACFYHFKTQSEERVSDDELIELMAKLYSGRCQGSIPYLYDTIEECLQGLLRGDDIIPVCAPQGDCDEDTGCEQ